MALSLIGTNPEIKVACIAEVTEGARTQKIKFNATFTRLDRNAAKGIKRTVQAAMDEVRALSRELIQLTDDDAERKAEIELRINEIDLESENLVRDYLKGWDLKDSGGAAFEFNEDNLEEALRWDPYFKALLDGLFKATGSVREEQRLKN